MPATKRGGLRLVDTVAFTAGKRMPVVNVQVGDRFFKRLWFYLTGALTVTGGTGAGTINPEGSVNILAKLEAYVNGVPYKSGSGAAFLRLGQRYDQTTGVNAAVASKAAGANNTLEALVPVCFEAMSTVSPVDTLIDGRFTDNISVYVTWGALTDLILGSDGALAAVNLQVEIYVEDTEPFPIRAPFWVNREQETDLDGVVTASGTRFILPVTPGAILRSILFKARDANVVTDAVLNRITLRVNGQEKPWDNIGAKFSRAKANHDFGNAAVSPQGWFHVELSEQGRVATTGLGARGARLNSLDAILDTTVGAGATGITAHLVEHVPPELIAAARGQA